VNDDLDNDGSGLLARKSSPRKDRKDVAGSEPPISLREQYLDPNYELRKEISAFLRQESLSPQRSKEEKIAALSALSAYLDDKDSARFLRQESFSQKRTLEERVAALLALGGGGQK
jgi:hypothetical protein